MEHKISFIHAADLHLDSPFKGLSIANETILQEVRQSTFHALDHLVEAAIKRKVDFVVLVGDLFDNDKPSLKAQIKLRHAFELLAQHDIKVYLSYGNHDYIKGNIFPITYPENVYVFPDEQVRTFIFEKDNIELASVTGFSYENRAVIERKAEEFTVNNSNIPFRIAMLHGSIESNTEHDLYAPFLLRDLIEKDFHYWALGHIHKREVLKENPTILYPGNIQGRNRKETGEKGCYYVEMTSLGTSTEFIPLQAIQFTNIELDVSDCEQIHDFVAELKNNLIQNHSYVPQLIDLSLTSGQDNLFIWKNEHLLEEIIGVVNEELSYQRNWLYVFRLTTKQRNRQNNIIMGEHFIGELMKNVDDVSISDYIGELFQHREARKYLDSLTKEEEEEIKLDAYQFLAYELQKM
ncbi:metallophosphoesterase family protein [Ornithinibacillus bavariensis]|uniref:DNA repair exonuclease n=1 Tax=Ornithinibacillus bavariensis TaxID=545502 RepID=A0A920C4G2_9BACI|nr:DNA repair exonuclease [Ornithinibacillus bavariensis]GIO25676.1 DNA repair exonuclease [Ornithinibacillus bavariensis]